MDDDLPLLFVSLLLVVIGVLALAAGVAPWLAARRSGRWRSVEGLIIKSQIQPSDISTDDNRDTSLMSSQEPTAGIVGPASVDPLAQTIRPDDPKLPTVEELTPSGDWTMTPGADGPTIAPRTSDPNLPTGDWLISLDHDAPDGWSEPSKIKIGI